MQIFLAYTDNASTEYELAVTELHKLAEILKIQSDFEINSRHLINVTSSDLSPHGQYHAPAGQHLIIFIIGDSTTPKALEIQLQAISRAKSENTDLSIQIFVNISDTNIDSDILTDYDNLADSIFPYQGRSTFHQIFSPSITKTIQSLKISLLAAKISSLTILQARQLKELLEERWGFEAASGGGMMMMAGGMPGAAMAAEEEVADYDEDESPSEVDIVSEEVTTTETSPQEVNFSCYFPQEVEPNRRFGFYVYAHLEDAAQEIAKDVTRFSDELGDFVPKPKKSKKKAHLQLETPITVIPECDEIEFDPPKLTKKWDIPWSRFGFDFKVKQDDMDETLFVRVSIQIEGIEIAHIKCAIEVVDKVFSKDSQTEQSVLLNNPLASAKAKSETVTPYQRIFISYSRRDSSVAKSYKIAQTALGNDAFLDVDNLRAGEDWRAALARAIDEADIFQLFWSEHSASSEYCRYEWDYALKVRCPDDNCEGFIRPVYWRKPMPSPPSELRRINFRFVPFEDQDD